jgi:hypothetical protein
VQSGWEPVGVGQFDDTPGSDVLLWDDVNDHVAVTFTRTQTAPGGGTFVAVQRSARVKESSGQPALLRGAKPVGSMEGPDGHQYIFIQDTANGQIRAWLVTRNTLTLVERNIRVVDANDAPLDGPDWPIAWTARVNDTGR